MNTPRIAKFSSSLNEVMTMCGWKKHDNDELRWYNDEKSPEIVYEIVASEKVGVVVCAFIKDLVTNINGSNFVEPDAICPVIYSHVATELESLHAILAPLRS